MTRRRLAEVWHILAVAYLLALYGAYALEIPDGVWLVRRAALGTVAILLATRILHAALDWSLRWVLRVMERAEGRDPAELARTRRRISMLVWVLHGALAVVAIALILMAWGADVPGWFATAAGREAMGTAVSVVVILGLALLAWELVSGMVERQLAAVERDTRSVERSARARTLLPLVRTTALIAVAAIAGLTVLAELGVDITPLVAGAGVIGLAIGFGSQALVKDVITGLFFLLENTVSVGDVVNVGGKGGLVEAISIRSLRLRDLDGTVHTIPFGSVSVISNMTKGFSHYVFDVRVSYGESTDRVESVLREVGEGLQRDPAFGALILEPLEVLGVDAFLADAIIVKARIKTRPIQQWNVGREFNRRLKLRFDELGIRIPLHQLTLHRAEGSNVAA